MKIFGLLSLVLVLGVGGYIATTQFDRNPPGVTDEGVTAIEQAKVATNDLVPLGTTFQLYEGVEVSRNMVILDLSSKNLSGKLTPEISQLVNLKELYLNDNNFTELPMDLTALEKLQVLDVSNNPKLTDIPNQVISMPNLIKVNIKGTAISKERQAELRDLLPDGAQLFD